MNIRTIRQRLLQSTMIGGTALMALTAVSATMLAAPTVAVAQDFTSGALTGTVTDTAGNPVSGATVVVSQNGAPFTRTVTTNESGAFRVSGAPIGRYSVTISGAGIETYTDASVPVSIGSASTYEFTVASSGGSTAGATDLGDVIVVGTRAAAVDFDRTTTGITVDVQETFDRLPIARNLTSIQLLAPGTTPGDTAFGNEVSISGSSVAENVYYINGMNVTNFRTFVGGNTVPFDFYQQVDVKTGGYQAEFGRSTGGAVVSVTRSGSDEFHGGANIYWNPNGFRETSKNVSRINPDGTTTLTANNDLDERDSLEGNVWLSGPVIKDHVYFFGLYNPRDISQSDTNGIGTRTDVTADDPFYGGKLDFYLNPDHRLEVTYFSDDQTQTTDVWRAGATQPETTEALFGGETTIYRYTGNFTDWFTLSATYGTNSFNQTVQGTADGDASVVGFSGQGTLRGNPAQLIETGIDERELFRIDADMYLDNFFGNHHFRFGFDQENLSSTNEQSFSGGIQYVYRGPSANPQFNGAVPAGSPYVRVRVLNSGGSFETKQSAFYIQDAWDVTERLSMQLGLRAEKFQNMNAAGDVFVETDYDLSPRIGVVYDLMGDQKTRVSGFYGRYYLPIAANTNIRMAGSELFTDFYHLYQNVGGFALDPSNPNLNTHAKVVLACAADVGNSCAPGGLSTPFIEQVNSDGSTAAPSSLASANLEAQYQDEFILGIQHTMDNGWRVGANLTYRDLKSVMEDFDTGYIIDAYCASAGISAANCGQINGSGYVLLNPGKDLIITPDAATFPFLAGKEITIPADILDIPQAERTYQALELTIERPWDGKWSLQGSAVFAKSEGNIEGGVKSDNGQDDTGLTQDFDEPGWTDGAFGLLPNHRGQTFKLFGSYAVTDSVTLGANVFIQSPRHYGCIGPYPFADGRAQNTTATAWYCDGKLTPRGSQFTGEWSKRVDLSLSWDLDLPLPGRMQFRADAFNIFNIQGVANYQEVGMLTATNPDPNYRAITGYQTPRNIRVGLSYQF